MDAERLKSLTPTGSILSLLTSLFKGAKVANELPFQKFASNYFLRIVTTCSSYVEQ